MWEGTYNNYEELPSKKSYLASDWAQLEYEKILKIRSSETQKDIIKSQNKLLIENLFNGASVIDYGGSLGISYSCLSDFKLNYTIIETTSICNFVKENSIEFLKNVSFYDYVPKIKTDLLYSRASLQYEKNWKKVLKELIKNKPNKIVFSSLPITQKQSFLSLQKWNKNKVPYWFFNLVEFKDIVSRQGYKIQTENIKDAIAENLKKKCFSIDLIFIKKDE